jgi:hypothetical protein
MKYIIILKLEWLYNLGDRLLCISWNDLVSQLD